MYLNSELSRSKREGLRQEAQQQRRYGAAQAPRPSLRAKLARILHKLAEDLEARAQPEPEHS